MPANARTVFTTFSLGAVNLPIAHQFEFKASQEFFTMSGGIEAGEREKHRNVQTLGMIR